MSDSKTASKNLAADLPVTPEVLPPAAPEESAPAAISVPVTGTTALGPVGPISKIYRINSGDIDVPWLNIIQKMSDIPGAVGDLIFDKRTCLAKLNEPVKVIVLEPRKGWKENFPFDSKEIARFAWSEEEKAKIEADSPVGVLECAELILLIPAPVLKDGEELDEATYMFPFAGHNYALGRIYVQKLGYRNTYKRINTFNLVNGNTGVRHTERIWTLETCLEESGDYKYIYPRLTVTTEPTDKALLEFILSLG
jgi:hypothetical protein